MIAVDTNVLARLLTEDDPEGAGTARSVFASGPIWIGRTVLLETDWVLRGVYGFSEGAIREAFAKLLGLGNVHAEDEASVIAALKLAAQGLKFADAMHLTSKSAGTAFVSFDREFVRRAKRAGAIAVSTVPPASA